MRAVDAGGLAISSITFGSDTASSDERSNSLARDRHRFQQPVAAIAIEHGERAGQILRIVRPDARAPVALTAVAPDAAVREAMGNPVGGIFINIARQLSDFR